jgi:hypothetical protein
MCTSVALGFIIELIAGYGERAVWRRLKYPRLMYCIRGFWHLTLD